MKENELFFEAGGGLRFAPEDGGLSGTGGLFGNGDLSGADGLFGDDGHLTDAGLRALLEDRLDELERLEAAEHLAFCGECMDRYTALLAGEALCAPPADLVLPVARRVRQKGLRLNLRRYAAAAAAAAVALALWGSGTFAQMVPQQADLLQQRPPEPPARTESLGSRVSQTLHGVLGAAGEMCGGLFQAGWSAAPGQQPVPAQPDAAQQAPDPGTDGQADPQARPEDGAAPQEPGPAPGRPANGETDPAQGGRPEEQPAQALAREPASAMRGVA